MKLVFLLALAVATVVGISSVANAAPYSTLPVAVGTSSSLNGATVGGSNVASGFGISFSGLGSSANLGPGFMTGTADASVSLDGSNNGTAQIVSTNLLLSNMSGPWIVPVLGLNLTFSLVDARIDIQMGPVTVTGGTFAIDSSTPGSINMNSGFLTVAGTALGAPVHTVVSLLGNPITIPFADLGATTIFGTADDSLAGDDTTTPGDEITLDWNGASSQFTFDIEAFPMTFDVILTSSDLSIGSVVPEPTSGLFLAGLVAGGAAVRRHRR